MTGRTRSLGREPVSRGEGGQKEPKGCWARAALTQSGAGFVLSFFLPAPDRLLGEKGRYLSLFLLGTAFLLGQTMPTNNPLSAYLAGRPFPQRAQLEGREVAFAFHLGIRLEETAITDCVSYCRF